MFADLALHVGNYTLVTELRSVNGARTVGPISPNIFGNSGTK